jgi:hypothetical protein
MQGVIHGIKINREWLWVTMLHDGMAGVFVVKRIETMRRDFSISNPISDMGAQLHRRMVLS